MEFNVLELKLTVGQPNMESKTRVGAGDTVVMSLDCFSRHYVSVF